MKFQTGCGGTIAVPPKAQDHLRAHPEMSEILAETISKVELPKDGSFLAVEIEMGRIVGLSGCVTTPLVRPNEKAFFAQRIGREKPSRIVLNSKGEETTKVVVLAFASREDKSTYVLVTSWIGSLAPKEPWDPNIKDSRECLEALSFWRSHALIYDPEVMGEVFESTWDEILK